jgi:hypothetical protein
MTVVCRRSQPGAAIFSRAFLSATLGMLALLAVGCGNNDIQNGTPVITVSSTNTRFTSFVVNIDSLSLTRDDANVFTALPTVERADLSKISDVSELLGAPAMPNGTYHTVTLVLDFTGAVVYVDVNGQNVAATVVDSSGVAVSTATLTFNLDKAKPLVVTTGKSIRFALDIDLAASTSVNTTTSPVTVTLNTMAMASLVPTNANPTHARGVFVHADPGAGTFAMNTQPFADVSSTGSIPFGALNVVTDAQTTFDVNGKTYVGSAGATALGTLALNTFVAAVGTFTDYSGIIPVLHATQVLAGTDVDSPSFASHLSGSVSAISGNSVTIHGANLSDLSLGFAFANDAVMTIGPNTVINADGQASAGLTTQAISVGSNLNVLGTAAIDDSGNITMDATAGEVRLLPTRLWGDLNSASAGTLDLNLLAIGQHEVSAFNFAGTGTAPAMDATPAGYAINAPSIDQSATPAATLLRVDGLVTAFGTAPPDFNATAVTLGSATDAILEVEWGTTGTAAPFATQGTSGLVANLGTSTVHQITTGPTVQDLTLLSASPTIVADPTNGSNFTLGGGSVNPTINPYSSFSDFITALGSTLNGTNVVVKLVAVGHWDLASNTFTATRISVVE